MVRPPLTDSVWPVTLSASGDAKKTMTIFLAYPAKRYGSALISILVHSAQSVVILDLATALVLS